MGSADRRAVANGLGPNDELSQAMKNPDALSATETAITTSIGRIAPKPTRTDSS
jgi:hypothetical protein